MAVYDRSIHIFELHEDHDIYLKHSMKVFEVLQLDLPTFPESEGIFSLSLPDRNIREGCELAVYVTEDPGSSIMTIWVLVGQGTESRRISFLLHISSLADLINEHRPMQELDSNSSYCSAPRLPWNTWRNKVIHMTSGILVTL